MQSTCFWLSGLEPEPLNEARFFLRTSASWKAYAATAIGVLEIPHLALGGIDEYLRAEEVGFWRIWKRAVIQHRK